MVRLSSQQQEWIKVAWAAVDEGELRQTALDMTSIPSPTGEEATLATYLAERLADLGLQGRYQPIDDHQANALGRLEGSGGAPDLLLYAPIDTLTTGRPAEDLPWIGPQLRSDMRPEATVRGEWIVGLGASNPKGHAACITEAAAALVRARTPLQGNLLVGLGAGGMPSNRRSPALASRHNAGQGSGCSFMLEQGTYPDFAIIAKPGWAVAWEEVGLCWFRVVVGGTFNYVGSRHRIPYRNPIVAATIFIQELESWLPSYAARNTSGLVAPQGNIGYIRSGWEETASLSPAECTILIDLRVSPRTPPPDVRRQFGEFVDGVRSRHAGLDVRWEMVLSIPGTSTPLDSPVVQACIDAWEAVEGKHHEPMTGTSGATDANILRNRGVPTARVGMPKAIDDQGVEVDFAMGMNAADMRHMVALTRLLIHSAIAICTPGNDPPQRVMRDE
jgi:acetylornithine deacetylase/succinyl-diaminopimelate desuccinylase-like protein